MTPTDLSDEDRATLSEEDVVDDAFITPPWRVPTNLSGEDLATVLAEGVDPALMVHIQPWRYDKNFCFPTPTTNLEESILSRLGFPVSLSAVVASTTTSLMVANAPSDSITFVVHFQPGLKIGIKAAHTFSISSPATTRVSNFSDGGIERIGARVSHFSDGGIESPGQARQSGVQLGDILLEVNDQPISHLPYDAIVSQINAMIDLPRKVLFLRRPLLLSRRRTNDSNDPFASPHRGEDQEEGAN